MEDSIIQAVADAERRAEEMRAASQNRAAEILTEAKKRAMELAKETDVSCAELSQEILSKAEADAEEAYHVAIQRAKEIADVNAEEAISRAENEIAAIVGRIIG